MFPTQWRIQDPPPPYYWDAIVTNRPMNRCGRQKWVSMVLVLLGVVLDAPEIYWQLWDAHSHHFVPRNVGLV
jgi:hypothetical protein